MGTSQADSVPLADPAAVPVVESPSADQGTSRRLGESAGRGRFITRWQLAGRALYWAGVILVSERGRTGTSLSRELMVVGVGAMRLVTAAALMTGVIATFQIATQLAEYSAEQMSARAIGWFSAREIGPVLVAVLIIARSAARMAGELASMTASGEIDALRAMGLDPVKYLAAPHIAALVIALPALTILADALIALGGWIANIFFLGFTSGFFLEQFRRAFVLRDLAVGLGKAFIFALVIGLVAADEGMSVERRMSAIGEAATRAVVFALIAVLAADTLVNAVFYFIPGLL